LREAWNTSKQEDIENKEKMQALTLAKECYLMKLDLLTNAAIVDEFVCDKSKDKERVKASSNNSANGRNIIFNNFD
jgi:hypothetical protein